MACAGHHMQSGLRPEAGQLVCRCRRADHVIPALHDDPRNIGNPVHPVQDLLILGQKARILEVVVFQPGKGAGIFRRAFATRSVIVDRGQGIFP